MNKHNDKPTGMFNKQDVAVYLTNVNILKDLNIINFRLHIEKNISERSLERWRKMKLF